jgi:hypothetical protein
MGRSLDLRIEKGSGNAYTMNLQTRRAQSGTSTAFFQTFTVLRRRKSPCVYSRKSIVIKFFIERNCIQMRHRKYFSIKMDGFFPGANFVMRLDGCGSSRTRHHRYHSRPAFERIPIAIPDFKFQTAGQPHIGTRNGRETLSSDGITREYFDHWIPEDFPKIHKPWE